MPELADHGIFQLTWLHVNCYVKMMKKYPLRLNLMDFMKILSVPQDYCGIHNNFRKIFLINYTLQGLYIVTFVSIVLRLKTRKYILIYQMLFKVQKNYFLGSNFINLSENLQYSKYVSEMKR